MPSNATEVRPVLADLPLYVPRKAREKIKQGLAFKKSSSGMKIALYQTYKFTHSFLLTHIYIIINRYMHTSVH